MLALKLYTDTTKFQSYLRRSFWTTSSLEMKKSFYFWAMTLYRSALYHAKPIQKLKFKSKGASPIFHGMNV